MSTSRRAAVAVLLVCLLPGCATESDSRDRGASGAATGPTTTASGGSMSPSATPPSPSGRSGGPPAHPPAGTPGGVTGEVLLTGVVEFLDIEGGCLVLRVGAQTYQLTGVDRQSARPGTTITARGRVLTDVATICQVGPVFQVTEIVPG